MTALLCGLWSDDEGQDIAEYAVMLAVIRFSGRNGSARWLECE
jgi:hypothetical protein